MDNISLNTAEANPKNNGFLDYLGKRINIAQATTVKEIAYKTGWTTAWIYAWLERKGIYYTPERFTLANFLHYLESTLDIGYLEELANRFGYSLYPHIKNDGVRNVLQEIVNILAPISEADPKRREVDRQHYLRREK